MASKKTIITLDNNYEAIISRKYKNFFFTKIDHRVT